MALINCKKCGKQISDKSNECIHCGYSIKQAYNNKIILGTIISFVIFIVIYMLVGFMFNFIMTGQISVYIGLEPLLIALFISVPIILIFFRKFVKR